MKIPTTDHWNLIEDIIGDALELPEDERQAYLDKACGEDTALREEVEQLYHAALQDDEFLADPVLDQIGARAVAELLDTLEEAFPEGSMIDHYEVIRKIGAGGMGTVYLARRADEMYTRQVALKVVSRGMNTDEILNRFRFERRLLARLEHPNIARLYGGGVTDNGLPYIAMEYVDGEPIDAYCNLHKLTVDKRLALFEKVCEAVQYAHSLVVHRDLKPNNVLVDGDGEVKLLDFGIARLIDTTETTCAPPRTQLQDRRLTPEYAAPEQITGAEVTPATDVYALGMMLYEFVTGHRPYHFDNHSITAIERTIVDRDPIFPSKQILREDDTWQGLPITPREICAERRTNPTQLKKSISGDLDAIILKAISKDPARRYGSAAALLADIRNYRSGHPVIARTPTFTYRASKFVRRYKGVVVTTALAFVILTAFLALAVVGFTRATENKERSDDMFGYFVSLLKGGAVDSYEQGGGRLGSEFTVPKIVEVGLADLDTLRHPLDRARFSLILGELALTNGRWDAAEQAYLTAFELIRASDDPEPVELAAVLSALALTAYNRASLPDSLNFFGRSDSLSGEAYAVLAGHPREPMNEEMPVVGSLEEAKQLVVTLNQWGRTLMIYGRNTSSQDTLRQALSLHREALQLGQFWLSETDSLGAYLADAHFGIANGRNYLGSRMRRSATSPEAIAAADDTSRAAEHSYRKTIELQLQSLGAEHPMLGRTYQEFADYLHNSGRTEEAIDYASLALEIVNEAYISPHGAQASLYFALGVYTTESDPEQAVVYVEEALRQSEQLDGPYTPIIRDFLSSIRE